MFHELRKFREICEAWSINIVFTACHSSFSEPHEYTPSLYVSYWRSIAIHFSPPSLYLPQGLLLSALPTKQCMHFFPPSYVSLAPLTCISFIWSPLSYLVNNKSWNISLCSFIQPACVSSLLVPTIFLSTLSWNTTSLCSSLSVTGWVSHS